jgi:type II restriction/modification system DNA methylase subunit YeeA
MMNEIVRIRKVLSTFIQEGPRTKYNFKRHCIEHTLYGVDIDPGAVEIAKLRLWLSLIVDEDDMDDIKPLPNLDYKIVCGDSLLGYPYIPRGLDKVEELKRQFFDEVDPNKKRNLRNRIDEAIFGLFKNTEGNLGYKVTIDYKINFSEVFSQNGGFDVVIANPPYIQLQKLRGNPLQNAYKSQNFEVHNANGDIYCLFYEKGMDILKKCGHLVFITSNKWMRAAYGEKLRRFFLEYNPLQLIDLGPGIFDSATVDTNILIIQKNKNKNSLQAATLSREDDSNLNILSALQTNGVTLKDLSQDTWFIGSNAELKLREKIERMGKPLREWDVKINYGIKTGLNEAFIIDTATRDRLVAEDPKSAEILKPILRGRDIKRYSYEWAGEWLVATGFDIDVPKLYPAVFNHLLKFKEKAQRRDDQGENWWNLRACAYYSEFEKEKVVWIELVDEGRFSCVESGIYTEATTFLMTHSRSKYLAGCLNSSLINWYFDTICASSGTGTNRWKKIYVELLPVLPIIPQNSSVIDKIEELTDEILTTKKQIISVDTQELEKQIDQLVYKLYDLTPQEIAIVEGSGSL